MFNPEMTLNKVHQELLIHLTENTYMTITDKPTLYLPNNGDVSFWFDDLVKVILEKVASSDPEIVRICLDNYINLFNIKPNV